MTFVDTTTEALLDEGLVVLRGYHYTYPLEIHEFDQSPCFFAEVAIVADNPVTTGGTDPVLPNYCIDLTAARWAEDDPPWVYPTDNDAEPTPPCWGDFDIPTWAEEAAWAAELHEALMGGWCAQYPDRPDGEPVVGAYLPGRQP